jgi:hypothetical protein
MMQKINWLLLLLLLIEGGRCCLIVAHVLQITWLSGCAERGG